MQSSAVAQAKSAPRRTRTSPSKNGVALVIGKVNATKLTKLAGLKGVVSVTSVQFKQTGSPTGDDPEVGAQPDRGTRNDALRAFQKHSVPYSKAPPLKTSNFDQLKSMNVLDAKTHNFTGAWKAGYTGTGVTASVLDGGTDWGHPDLIGTWQTWSAGRRRATAPTRAGSAGRRRSTPTARSFCSPRRSLVPQGLSWYTLTQTAACTYVKRTASRRRRTTERALLGQLRHPDRPGAQPAGARRARTLTRTRFPAAWTKSGTVKLASHPDEYLLELYGERPAVLVTDPTVAGQYDTVYVDLTTTTTSPTRSRSRRARRSRTAT